MANHLSYEVMNRLLEGRAAGLEHERAQRHLVRCGRCRSEREWLQRIRNFPTGSNQDPRDPSRNGSAARAFVNADWLGHPA